MHAELGDYERRRYARQLALPGWDVAAQVRLADATVCILGATPEAAATALALAGAGVGTLVLDAGLGDVPARVAALTTLCAVRVGPDPVEAGGSIQSRTSLWRFAPGAEPDVVVEAGAGAAARAALDGWAREARVPWVVAVSDGWDAQVAVLDQRVAGAPCARCVWPAPDERAESDAPAAPVAAWAGALAALEVVKLLGQGGSAGHARLMLLSGLAGDVRMLRLRRDPGCLAHGDGDGDGASAGAGAGAGAA